MEEDGRDDDDEKYDDPKEIFPQREDTCVRLPDLYGIYSMPLLRLCVDGLCETEYGLFETESSEPYIGGNCIVCVFCVSESNSFFPLKTRMIASMAINEPMMDTIITIYQLWEREEEFTIGVGANDSLSVMTIATRPSTCNKSFVIIFRNVFRSKDFPIESIKNPSLFLSSNENEYKILINPSV